MKERVVKRRDRNRPAPTEMPLDAVGGDPSLRRIATTSLLHPIAFALIVAVGIGLAFYAIGEKGLWVDEGTSVWIASLSPSEAWDVLSTAEANAGLYYILLWVWMRLGDSEAFIRALSAIFAVGTVPMLYLLVRRIAGSEVALAAAIILVINASWVHYAQEARGYALAMFLATTGSYLLLRLLTDAPRWLWLSYGLVMGAAVYAHLYAGFVLLAHLVSLPLFGLRRDGIRRSLCGLALGAVLALPLVAFVVTNDAGQVDWLRQPDAGKLMLVIEDFVGGVGPALTVALGGFVVLSLVSWVAAWWTAPRDPVRIWGAGMLLLWLVIPIVAGFFLSQIKPLLHPRFLIVALPALAGVVAFGIAALRQRVLVAASLAGVVALAASGLPTWYEDTKQPWREITEFVNERAAPGDRIVFYSPTTRRPIEYYVERTDREDTFPTAVFPEGGWGSHPIELPPYKPDLEVIGRGAAEARRVWYVASQADRIQLKEVQKAIMEQCRDQPTVLFEGRLRVLALCGE